LFGSFLGRVVSDETLPICSAKGCRVAAVWVLAWNNPKLHTPERRKTWLACDEHREHLSQFLGVRGFLKDVVTLAEWEAGSASDR
jgi:surfactin synthase thioesterase subunit